MLKDFSQLYNNLQQRLKTASINHQIKKSSSDNSRVETKVILKRYKYQSRPPLCNFGCKSAKRRHSILPCQNLFLQTEQSEVSVLALSQAFRLYVYLRLSRLRPNTITNCHDIQQKSSLFLGRAIDVYSVFLFPIP